MAQHLYSGEPPEKLLENGGKGDASDIRKVLEQYRNQGATGDDCDKLYSRAYLISLKLVKHYWWEIIALAKMVEHYNYVASNLVNLLIPVYFSHPQKRFRYKSFMIMRSEQGAGLQLVMQVFRHGPGDGGRNITQQ